MGKRTRNIALVGAGVALSAYLVKKIQKRKEEIVGNFSPLIDRVNVTTDGMLSERWSFAWDDEERCDAALEEKFDSLGNVTSQRLLVFDFTETKVEISEYHDGDDVLCSITTLFIDDYGMVSTVIHRQSGGKEQRWDTEINGAELAKLASEDNIIKMYWKEGNLHGVSYDREVRQKMTYYSKIKNYTFPDVNLFLNGLSSEMLNTYMLGTRSRNFLRTMVVTAPNYHQQSHVSYLLDSYDRPIQVLIETSEQSNDITTNSSKEFDIKYNKI